MTTFSRLCLILGLVLACAGAAAEDEVGEGETPEPAEMPDGDGLESFDKRDQDGEPPPPEDQDADTPVVAQQPLDLITRFHELLSAYGVEAERTELESAAVSAMLHMIDPGALILHATNAAAEYARLTGPFGTNRVVGSVPTNDMSFLEVATIQSNATWITGHVYIKLRGLHPGSGRIVIRQLIESDNADTRGLILDLRGASGWDLESVVEIMRIFPHGQGVLFSVRDRHGNDRPYNIKPFAPVWTKPMVTLVDAGTRGASELLAVLLSRIRGMLIVGESTHGDNRIRELVPFDENRTLYMATKYIVLSDGSVYAPGGITPDLEIANDANLVALRAEENDDRPISDTIRNTRDLMELLRQDPPLSRALSILIGIRALGLDGRSVSKDSSR